MRDSPTAFRTFLSVCLSTFPRIPADPSSERASARILISLPSGKINRSKRTLIRSTDFRTAAFPKNRESFGITILSWKLKSLGRTAVTGASTLNEKTRFDKSAGIFVPDEIPSFDS